MTTSTCIFLVTMLTLLSFSVASYFHVGGPNGWSSSKNVNYTQWADSIHFQVDDVLIFEYDNKTENVLQVSPSVFKSCNLTSPSRTWTSGNDQVHLPRQGVYHFISSLDGKCGGRAMVTCQVYENGHKHNDTPSPGIAPAPKHSSAVTVKASLFALCIGFLIMISA